MKKISALILSISLIAQICFFTSMPVRAKSAAVNNNADMALAVLNEIGVLDSSDVADIDSDIPVTRAAFAVYAAKAAKIPGVSGKMYFRDVPQDHWAADYVNALTELNVIDMSDDGMFNPGREITYEQAVKIMVVLTGYKEYALMEADIMKGYTIAAEKTGIAVKTASRDKLTLREAVSIIFNAMQIDITMPILNGTSAEYTVQSGNNLLRLHDVYISEGKVNAIYGNMLSEAYKVSEDEINISGEILSCESLADLDKSFGKTVDYAYVKKSSGKNALIYIEKGEENTVIFGELIKNYDSQTKELSYYQNEKSDKAKIKKIDNGTMVIFNGKPFYGDPSNEINKFISGDKKGSVEIIDEKVSGTSPIMIIKSYEVLTASGYDSDKGIIFDEFDNTRKINIKNADTLIMKNAKGSSATMPTNFPAVLAIGSSLDGDRSEIIICDSVVNSVIESVKKGDREIKCSGEIYEINKDVWDKFEGRISAGTSVTLYLDLYGDVAYIEFGTAGSMKLGYLIDVAVKTDSFDKTYMMKIYYDGKVNYTNLADKVVLDGETVKMTSILKFVQGFPTMTLSGDKISVSPQVIRFNLNNDGEIREIDTYNVSHLEDKNYTLKLSTSEASKPYWITFKRFGMETPYAASNSTVFVVPKVDANGNYTLNGVSVSPDDSEYKTGYNFQNAYNYNIESYNYNYDNPYTDVIVLKQTPTIENKYIYMFDELYESVNSDGDTVNIAVLWTKEGQKEIEIDDAAVATARTLNPGDLIYIADKNSGGAASVTKLFDVATKTFTSGNKYWYDGVFDVSSTWNYSKKYQLSKVYVYDIINDLAEGCYEFSDLTDGNVLQRDMLVGIPIYLFDSNEERGDKIKPISITEVKSYMKNGNEADLMLIASTGESLRNAFIIR